MTGPTDIEIERAIEALNNNHWHIVADMMLALKARAKAAEQSRAKFMEQLRVMGSLADDAEERAHYANGVADTNINRANEAETRAEAAEKREAALREALEDIATTVTTSTTTWRLKDKARAALEAKP